MDEITELIRKRHCSFKVDTFVNEENRAFIRNGDCSHHVCVSVASKIDKTAFFTRLIFIYTLDQERTVLVYHILVNDISFISLKFTCLMLLIWSINSAILRNEEIELILRLSVSDNLNIMICIFFDLEHEILCFLLGEVMDMGFVDLK